MISTSPTDLPERPRPGHPISRSLKPISNSQNHRAGSFSSNPPSLLPLPSKPNSHPHTNGLTAHDSAKSSDLSRENREKSSLKSSQSTQSHELSKLQASAIKVKQKSRPFEPTDPLVRAKTHKPNSVSGPVTTYDDNRVSVGGNYHLNGHDILKMKASSRGSSPFSGSSSSRQAERPSSGHSNSNSRISSQKTRRQATSPVFSSAHDTTEKAPVHAPKINSDSPKPSQNTGKPPLLKQLPEVNRKPAALPEPFPHPKSGLPKRKVDRFGGTSLARRAEKGNLGGVEDAYQHDSSELDQPDNAGVAPLQKAACHGHLAVVKFLIDKGCSITGTDQEGDTPLIDAVANGHLPVVIELLRAGVNPHHANRYGRRAFDHLPATDDPDCEPIDNEIRTLLWDSMQAWTNNNAHVEQEPDAAPPIESKPSTRHDLLYIDCTMVNLRKFAGQGDAVAVNHIMAMVIPDVSCAVAAARGGHNDILSFILATMDPSEKDPDPLKYSETPILAAIGRGHLDILELILNQDNFNPTRRTKEGKLYWQVAEERRGPKWPAEVQLLKKRYDEFEPPRSNSSASRKRSAVAEVTESASRPAKFARTTTDRSMSLSSKPKLSSTSHRSSVSTSSSEKVSLSEPDRSNGRAAKPLRPSKHKQGKERATLTSSSPPPHARESLVRRRRVVDDEDDEEESLSDRMSPPMHDKLGGVSLSKSDAQGLQRSTKSTSKISKSTPTNDLKKAIRSDHTDLIKNVKRERVNSVGELNRPSTGTKQSTTLASSDIRDLDRKLPKGLSSKDEHSLRRRPSVSREAKSSTSISAARDKSDRPRSRHSLDMMTSGEKELITQEIRDRIEREERSRIAKEERDKVLVEERARILQEEKEALELERIEQDRKQQEEQERAEQERQRIAEEDLRNAEEAERRRAEEAETARKVAEEEETARKREELLDTLPIAVSHAIRAGPDRPLRATGLKMGVMEQFLPIWTVPFREITTDPSPSRHNERWMMNWQVVGLLGLPDLDLASEAVGLGHWERIPVTERQMTEWLRYYTCQQLCSLGVIWPDSPDYCPSQEAAKLKECQGQLFSLWPHFCWIRLSDFLAEIEHRQDLRSLSIGQVDDGAFVSPDGTGYGGRYVEGHAAFGHSTSRPASIRELIFQSHGLPCPKSGGTLSLGLPPPEGPKKDTD